jgi:3-deoxy-D-manno-octulosonic-acid transferase
MRFFYTIIFYISLPLILLRLYWRSRQAPAYARRWRERFGFITPLVTDKTVVWLHTVSVGEFLGALPLIRLLLQAPSLQLVITTTTPTGSERVQTMLGNSVTHVYAPYDLPDVVARFLRRIQPRLLVIMETELWPNTIAACAKREIPVLLINARLSARSARGYQRFAAITRPMLQQLTGAAIQHIDDAERFAALGLPAINSHVTGNIKFDLTLSSDLQAEAQRLKQIWSHNGQRVIWIAASTHQGEDEKILDAFVQIRAAVASAAKNSLLVLVPRHPERFLRVENLCKERGFTLSKRSERSVQPDTDILLGDTMGELLLMFGASDIAFVGGSLVPNGGHNFIEPAAWQLPLLSGPHVFNFAEVARLLQQAGALNLVGSASELAQQVEILLVNADERQRRGEAARAVADANRGALEKTLKIIEQYL